MLKAPPRRRRRFFSRIDSDMLITFSINPLFSGIVRLMLSCTHLNSFPSMSNGPRSFGSKLPHDQACSLLLA